MRAAANRRIARNTLALYFRTLLTMLVTLYTSRVVIEALGVSDFGLFSLVGGIVVLMGFLKAAMLSATQRFLNYEKGRPGEDGGVRRVFATSLYIHLFLAVLVLIIAQTLGLWFLNAHLKIPPGRMDAANWVYQCALLAFLVGVTTTPFNAAIIANERMTAFAYVSILDVSLKLALAYALFHFPGDRLKTYAALVLLASTLVALVYVWYARRNFPECRVWPARDAGLFRQMLSFSSWSILSNLSIILRLQGTNIILNLLFGTLINAAFGLALQVYNAIQSFSSSFTVALNPPIVKAYAAGELPQMHALVLNGCRLAFFLVLLLVLPVLMDTNALLRIWLVNVPDHTTVFVQLVLVQAMVESFAGVTGVAQGATGRIGLYHLTLSITGFLNLPVSYLLLRDGFPPYVVFVVAIALSSVIAVIRLLFLGRSIGLPLGRFVREVALRCMAVAALAPLAPLLLRRHIEQTPLNTILVCAAAGFSVLAVVALVGLRREERRMALAWVAGKLRAPR